MGAYFPSLNVKEEQGCQCRGHGVSKSQTSTAWTQVAAWEAEHGKPSLSFIEAAAEGDRPVGA